MARKDLHLFKHAKLTDQSNNHSQKDISAQQLFSGVTVKQFSRMTFNEWIQTNIQTLLAYFQKTFLYPVVQVEPEYGIKLFPFLVSLALSLEEDRVKDSMEEAVSF